MATVAPVKKGIAAALAGAMALTMLGLSGCVVRSSGDAERIAELEREVATLQEQIGDQGSSQDQNSAAQDSSSESGSASSSSQGNGWGAGSGSGSGASAGISGIEMTDETARGFAEHAETLIAEASAAEIPTDRNALISTYFDFEQRFDQLDDEMDLYGDQKELEARNGTISWEEYRSIKLQLDAIEHDLDRAENELECRFGVDD